MKTPINVFIIESEIPCSHTSVRRVWGMIKSSLKYAGCLGRNEFYDAPTKDDLKAGTGAFKGWTTMLPNNEPVVLWISIHGANPKHRVPNIDRRLVGTSAVSTIGEPIAWHEFFDIVKQADNPERIIVLMDVCWGASPTAASRLSSPRASRPNLLFGPARSALRSELDTASKSLFDIIIKRGIPDVIRARDLVDSINL